MDEGGSYVLINGHWVKQDEPDTKPVGSEIPLGEFEQCVLGWVDPPDEIPRAFSFDPEPIRIGEWGPTKEVTELRQEVVELKREIDGLKKSLRDLAHLVRTLVLKDLVK